MLGAGKGESRIETAPRLPSIRNRLIFKSPENLIGRTVARVPSLAGYHLTVRDILRADRGIYAILLHELKGKYLSMKVISFAEALKESERHSKRHILLGNGFSIACRANIFVYDRLFEQADFSRLSPAAREAFTVLSTTDFERVIKALRDSAALAAAYRIDPHVAQQMIDDSNNLKEILVQTIAASHPEIPSDISDDEYAACQKFLAHFSTIYTFNYDLLLYWTRMHQEWGGQTTSDDGFRPTEEEFETGLASDYVVWESSQAHDQNMWFLHGALHVFDTGTEIRKFTWVRTGIRLIEQIRNALQNDFFPLFVAEGTSDEKLERVRHSDYLAKAYRSFESIGGCLFIYGHSLAENDEHYLRLIERGKITDLFVGLHGNPDSDGNKRIVRRAELMKSNRGNRRPLRVTYYDSGSASVWGH